MGQELKNSTWVDAMGPSSLEHAVHGSGKLIEWTLPVTADAVSPYAHKSVTSTTRFVHPRHR